MKTCLSLWLAPFIFGSLGHADAALRRESLSCASSPGVTVEATFVPGPATVSADSDVHWVNGTDVVFILMTHPLHVSHDLFRSTDNGKTWVDQAPYLVGADAEHGNKTAKGVIDFYVAPADPSVIYFAGYGGFMWVTQDAGNSYAVVTSSEVTRIYTVEVHPSDSSWALVLGDRPKCTNATSAGTCFTNLLLTKNFGVSWVILDTYVHCASWGDAGIGGISKEDIWVHRINTTVSELQLLHSDNLMRSYDVALPGADVWRFEFIRSVAYTLGWYFIPEKGFLSFRLKYSADNGATWQIGAFPDSIRPGILSTYWIFDTANPTIGVSQAEHLSMHLTTSGSFVEKFEDATPLGHQLGIDQTVFSPMLHHVRGTTGVLIAGRFPLSWTEHGWTKSSLDGGSTWSDLTLSDLETACTGCSLHLHTTGRTQTPHLHVSRDSNPGPDSRNTAPLYSSLDAPGNSPRLLHGPSPLDLC
jgi:Sortilin, neurotensin receptor 3,